MNIEAITSEAAASTIALSSAVLKRPLHPGVDVSALSIPELILEITSKSDSDSQYAYRARGSTASDKQQRRRDAKEPQL